MNILIVLLLFSSLTLSINATSTNFSVGKFIQVSEGGNWSSSNFSTRDTLHYQQPVIKGDSNAGTFSADLRWIGDGLAAFVPSFNITYVVQACNIDNQTLETNTIIQMGIVNTTVNILQTNCPNGCDPIIGACKDLPGTSKINFLLLFSLIASILISYLMIRFLGDEHSTIRLLMLLIMIILLGTLNYVSGIMGDYFTGAVIDNAGAMALTIASVLQWATWLLIMYFAVTLIIHGLSLYNFKKNKGLSDD